MDTTQLEARLQETVGKLKQKYGDLIDDEVTKAKGVTDEVIGKLRKKLDKTEEEVRNEIEELSK